MNFSEWIESELVKRGWSRSEAARRGGISPSMFDKVINGFAKPGTKFISGIAQAFGVSPAMVFQKLKGETKDNEEVSFEDWKTILNLLTSEEQEEIRQIAEMKIERRQKSEQSARAAKFKEGMLKK